MEFCHAPPRDFDAEFCGNPLDFSFGFARHGCLGDAAVADDLGGHTLADLALGKSVRQQGHVRVGVRVNESRRDMQPLRGYHALCFLIDSLCNQGNLSGCDPQICFVSRFPFTVQHHPVLDQDIQHLHILSSIAADG